MQKPVRIYTEKSLKDISHQLDQPFSPGDRDDNQWVTLDNYQPPQTQSQWEETCFLDKSYHGYFCWPQMIKYPMNKRERYTEDNMPKEAAIIYDHFRDKNFVERVIQAMTIEEENEANDVHYFDQTQFSVFKVKRE